MVRRNSPVRWRSPNPCFHSTIQNRNLSRPTRTRSDPRTDPTRSSSWSRACPTRRGRRSSRGRRCPQRCQSGGEPWTSRPAGERPSETYRAVRNPAGSRPGSARRRRCHPGYRRDSACSKRRRGPMSSARRRDSGSLKHRTGWTRPAHSSAAGAGRRTGLPHTLLLRLRPVGTLAVSLLPLRVVSPTVTALLRVRITHRYSSSNSHCCAGFNVKTNKIRPRGGAPHLFSRVLTYP